MKLRLILISDTHGLHRELNIPSGDVLIHAGDVLHVGQKDILTDFNKYLGTLPHPHKIVIAGNHDACFEQEPNFCNKVLTNAIYLQDKSVSLGGIQFYGSPWQPWLGGMAFNLKSKRALQKKWALIPSGIDVLITHTPPFGILDETAAKQHVGCFELLASIGKTKPKVHVFGHIHENPGKVYLGGVTFINASICNVDYRLAYQPIIFDYEKSNQ